MRRIIAAAILLAGLLSLAIGQGLTPFPQTLPANTVVGRLGISAGPSQAIPFSVLGRNLNILPSVAQVVTAGTGTIATATDYLIVDRAAPTSTLLTLPNASLRSGRPLAIIDFSSSVTSHTTLLTPFSVNQKVMRQSTWSMFSNTVSLASLTLIPVADPDSSSNYVWIIAP